MKKNKCLISTCNGRIKNADKWKIEGAIDIRSYKNYYGDKLYNVTIQMEDGFAEGEVDRSLRLCLRRIANMFNMCKSKKGGT